MVFVKVVFNEGFLIVFIYICFRIDLVDLFFDFKYIIVFNFELNDNLGFIFSIVVVDYFFIYYFGFFVLFLNVR